ncbi:MAG: hypothetical protein HRT89_17775 [Lentisphaeria bacterium]|nr:hypothetical protein [Lentisphaeria bacterium]NQZ69907.1 hypothetical protein [Lentisphaeria bacterium]
MIMKLTNLLYFFLFVSVYGNEGLLNRIAGFSPAELKDKELQSAIVKLGMPAHEKLKTGNKESYKLRMDLCRKIRAVRDTKRLNKGLVIHEWGTFKYLQDSNEIEIGMRDNISDLPGFVQVWNKQPNIYHSRIIKKPILYFYPKFETSINVTVKCPTGILTQWWPNVSSFSPRRMQNNKIKVLRRNGTLSWRNIRFVKRQAPKYSKADKHPWWNKLRNVDASILNVNGVDEKFLFYRGVASRKPVMKASYAKDKLRIENTSEFKLGHVFVVYVKNAKVFDLQFSLDSHAAKNISIKWDQAVDVKTRSVQLRKIFQYYLEELGLFPKESKGMTDIWQKQYFENEGLRIFYVMPRKLQDSFLKLSFSVTPVSLIRTNVVQYEIFTPEREKAVFLMIQKLGAETFRERRKAQEKLLKADEFSDAYMKKVLNEVDDPEISERLKSILLKRQKLRHFID